MSEQVLIVAVVVDAADPNSGAERVYSLLGPLTGHRGGFLEWWHCEDWRLDGSDNDSAVFVPFGTVEAWQHLREGIDNGSLSGKP